MEWLERLNQSLDYLEENLSGTISYERAAQIACCSAFHYQRMFSYIAGIPLGEYIRRRRMTEAAFDLQTKGSKVIDAALKYGYESPTSFNRAFQSVHGVSPASARTEGVILKAFPRISFKISIRGDAEMNYKIQTKDAFRIVGVKKYFPMDVEESFAKVPLFLAGNSTGGQNINALRYSQPATLWNYGGQHLYERQRLRLLYRGGGPTSRCRTE